MIVRAKAPLRISFCGGGTDVAPYPQEKGGVVLNATLDKYAFASLVEREDTELRIQSLDYDIAAKYNINGPLEYNGELDLVKAVVRHFKPGRGLDLFIHSDAPPGSGLGSSSTMTAAMVGTFKHWLNEPLTDYEIAELTYKIERIDLKIAGGKQDQYAATFGGFNFIEFYDKAVVVNPLRVNPSIINELEYNLLLCYTGKTRLSANIVANQAKSYIERESKVVAALDEMKVLTVELKNCLLKGKLNEFGRLLHDAWENKKKLNDKITSPIIDTLYEIGRKNGVLGGKILGAGGGGYLLLYCPFQKKHIVAAALEKAGGQVVKFSFEPRGLQIWEVR
ncbi:GHMP kinase [candidate division KSB1 bacterium]|nr:GHMP kinase [candidate division KSB1 bacterium]